MNIQRIKNLDYGLYGYSWFMRVCGLILVDSRIIRYLFDPRLISGFLSLNFYFYWTLSFDLILSPHNSLILTGLSAVNIATCLQCLLNLPNCELWR